MLRILLRALEICWPRALCIFNANYLRIHLINYINYYAYDKDFPFHRLGDSHDIVISPLQLIPKSSASSLQKIEHYYSTKPLIKFPFVPQATHMETHLATLHVTERRNDGCVTVSLPRILSPARRYRRYYSSKTLLSSLSLSIVGIWCCV